MTVSANKNPAQPRIQSLRSGSTDRGENTSGDVFERLSRSSLIFAPPERTAMRGLGQALARMTVPVRDALETAHDELGGV